MTGRDVTVPIGCKTHPRPRSLSRQQPVQSYRLRPHPPNLWTVPTRGHFPHDDAVLKLLYLVLNLASKEWRMPPREWAAAKAQFAILFEDRFAIA